MGLLCLLHVHDELWGLQEQNRGQGISQPTFGVRIGDALFGIRKPHN